MLVSKWVGEKLILGVMRLCFYSRNLQPPVPQGQETGQGNIGARICICDPGEEPSGVDHVEVVFVLPKRRENFCWRYPRLVDRFQGGECEQI